MQAESPCIGSGRYGDDRGALPFAQTFVDDGQPTPDVFKLYSNYPNPFNASTTIHYSLSEPAQVTIKIYDVLGKELSLLLIESQIAGYHKLTWDAKDMPSGVYFYNIRAGEFSETRKMSLLK